MFEPFGNSWTVLVPRFETSQIDWLFLRYLLFVPFYARRISTVCRLTKHIVVDDIVTKGVPINTKIQKLLLYDYFELFKTI